ncbi:MAG: cobalamin-dependent protein [Burkholderiales bacterium]|nr:cobalamin-dependent protein [Burkholderiales bacterium]
MPIGTGLSTLDAEGLQRFKALQADAISAVTERFYTTHGSAYAEFGKRGREACREDLAYHLEFLRPALEFGLLQPMVDYLCWLSDVLHARSIPAGHLGLSLDWLAEFFVAHMDAADGTVVAATLHAARDKFLAAGNTPTKPPTPPAAWPEAGPFESALLAGNQREALAVVNRCIDRGHSLIEVEMHVIQPALYQIGEKWQANQVTVAQEHMATAIVQSVMTMGLLRSPPPALISKRILLACVPGNDHAIGLRMVADAFQLGGWDVQYLGANVPTPALVAQAVEWKPDLVGLSVSFPQQLPEVKTIIEQLGARFGSARPAVIIGGLAINRFNRLAGMVGADAYMANAQAALASANSMVSG